SQLKNKGKYKNIIPLYYQKMDEVIGKVIRLTNKNTPLLVLSDHGFGPFDWEINLNTWLKQNGFLYLKSGSTSPELYENVDWSKTTAFAAGFNSVYLNAKGRENQGIVEQKNREKVIKKIKAGLKNLKNTFNKKSVIKNVYSRKDLNIPENIDAPDLIVGYYQGFRSSWETAVGAAPEKTIKKRTAKWSGDHLFDASEVPGVIFSNKKLELKNPFIGDIMPFVLKKLKAYQ
ncbi:unnamed protein product, partial [marine sediment metagenome]